MLTCVSFFGVIVLILFHIDIGQPSPNPSRQTDFLNMFPNPSLPLPGVKHYGNIANHARDEKQRNYGDDDTKTKKHPQEESMMMKGARSLGLMESDSDDKKKKPDPVAGFLGITNMMNPVIQLRRLTKGQKAPEPDCVRTYFMGPFAKSVTFSANGTVGAREDRTCKWSFIGTEPCIPMLDCSQFNLNKNCKETLEVFDGNVGFEKFCEKDGPANTTASGGLRDLFIRYKASEPQPADTIKFQCTVSCSKRGEGKELEQVFEPKINTMCQCGKRPNTNKIVNGDNATRHEFPWMAGLVRAYTRQPFCGASILNDRMLVTAGHCFKGDFLQVSNLQVLLGGHIMDVTPNYAALSEKPSPQIYDPITLSLLDSGNGSVRFSIEEVIIHPLYVVETNDFDVAIIKLSEAIDFSKYPHLNPVCIPKLGSYLRSFSKKTGIVAGWGLGGAENKGTNSILQKLNVTIYTPKECKDTYAHRVNRRMLCAGYVEGGKDSCMGDSGGPLVLEDKPHIWYQVGTVSWGEGCAQSKSPGAYIRLTEVGQWIHYHSNSIEANWCAVPSSKQA